MMEHAVTNESWASIFVIGCMVVGSIGVTIAVVLMLVFGIRRVALMSVGNADSANKNVCQNAACGCFNPMTAVFCRRCGQRLATPAARAPQALSA